MSQNERDSVLNIIKKYPNASNNEIGLRARGMNLNNVADMDKAIQYVDVFNNMGTPPKGYEGQISSYLNR